MAITTSSSTRVKPRTNCRVNSLRPRVSMPSPPRDDSILPLPQKEQDATSRANTPLRILPILRLPLNSRWIDGSVDPKRLNYRNMR